MVELWRRFSTSRGRWWALAIFVIVGPVFVTVGYTILTDRINTNARVAYEDSCRRTNTVAAEALRFVDGQLDRSKASYDATLASPAATGLQKRAAVIGLEQLPTVRKAAADAFAAADCTYPPTTNGP